MSLPETLAVHVGTAVGKAIFKLWLKDAKIGADVSSQLGDLFALKVSGAIDQRRAQREFEQIAEQVGESLLVLFNLEGSSFTENGRLAVAYAAADSLNRTPFSPALLARHNLEPTELARCFIESNPNATRDLSSAESALYVRIINEVSQYVIDISHELPRFTEQVLSEILTREGEILQTAKLTLQEVRRLREVSQDTNTNLRSANFELEYRQTVMRKLDQIELFGVDLTATSRRHRLSVAYISLSLTQQAIQLIRSQLRRKARSLSPAVRESNVVLSVEDVLVRSSRVMVRGVAGSGKTTLLQWIAVRAASQNFAGYLESWNDLVPFFVRLRHCVENGFPSPEDIPGMIAPLISGGMPHGWVHQLMLRGRAVLLVDGVDEVPRDQREKAREWLIDLCETFPQVRVVVTSRPHALDGEWLQLEGFVDAELQPMDFSDIDSFVEHWHEAVKEQVADDEKQELNTLSEDLKRLIRRSRSLRNLATSPLLCAMLCALHRDSHQQIPTDRIELYQACCKMLLDRRDLERQIRLTDYVELTFRQKQYLVQDFAFWLLVNGWSEVSVPAADQKFDLAVSRMEKTPTGTTGEQVRKLLVERTAILREPSPNVLDFTHRTFQEFLAAQAIIDEGSYGVLASHANNDQWREVIILAAGLSSRRRRDALLTSLIRRGDEDRTRQYQLHLLAVTCLETSVSLSPKVKLQLQERLGKLLPARSLADAKALASAGELAIPYLAYSATMSQSEMAFNVQALIFIGGELALDALEAYAVNAGQSLSDEFVKGWPAFERHDYARRILGPALVDYRVFDESSLDGVQHLRNLRSLVITKGGPFIDSSALTGLTKLRRLTLRNCPQLESLDFLSEVPNVESLEISNARMLNNVRGLAHIGKLTSLSLTALPELTGLEGIERCSNLQSVEIVDCGRITNCEPVRRLEALTKFRLVGTPVGDLEPLRRLERLRYLDLSRCVHVQDISAISGLADLAHLDLYGLRDLEDLSGLVTLKQLRWLSLSGCRSVHDVIPLIHLPKLRYLNLVGCERLTGFDPLFKMNELDSININQSGLASETEGSAAIRRVRPDLNFLKTFNKRESSS